MLAQNPVQNYGDQWSPQKLSVKLSCRADEQPRTLEETTHAKEDSAMKHCQPHKETNHSEGDLADVVYRRIGTPGGAPGTQDGNHWVEITRDKEGKTAMKECHGLGKVTQRFGKKPNRIPRNLNLDGQVKQLTRYN